MEIDHMDEGNGATPKKNKINKKYKH